MRPAVALLAAAVLAGCLSHHTGPMPGEPRRASYLELRGTRVRYVDRGRGPAVVLLHGFASALDTWDRIIPRLARDHRVLALDLKGFGWTDRPAGDYSPREQAQLVKALLDARGVTGPVALVAHSWGASVALAFALRYPSRVSRLALYDAWVYEEQLPTFFLWSRTPGLGEALFSLFYKERPDERLAMAFYDPSVISERFAEDVERALERPGTLAAALAAVRGQRYDLVQDRYRTVRVPALLLWGREDAVTPLSYGERLARDLPDARLVVYPRCGHLPMIEAAGASTRDLVAFLGEDAP